MSARGGVLGAVLWVAVAPVAAGCAGMAPLPDGGGAELGTADGAPPDLATADGTAHGSDGGFGTPKGQVKLTYYWVASQLDYPGTPDTAVCDVTGKVLAMVPAAFANALALEGTGKLSPPDGRLLNAAGNCTCPGGLTTCYDVLDPAKYPWGVGAASVALRPFRSVAVDMTFVALGTHIYVPELDGVQMPASYGFVHDGCLTADDVGGGIVGAHFDFFAAEKANYLTLDAKLKLTSVSAFVNPQRCP